MIALLKSIFRILYKFLKWIIIFSLLIYLGLYYPNTLALFIIIWITYKAIF